MELYKIRVTDNNNETSTKIKVFNNTIEFENYSVARLHDSSAGLIKDFKCEHLNLDEIKSMKTSEILDTISFGDFCKLVKELGD